MWSCLKQVWGEKNKTIKETVEDKAQREIAFYYTRKLKFWFTQECCTKKIEKKVKKWNSLQSKYKKHIIRINEIGGSSSTCKYI